MESLRRILEFGKKKAATSTPKTEEKPKEEPKSDRPKPADSRDFLGLRGAMKERERAAGLKCGGMVHKKGYKEGGMVRGCGMAKKGKTKGKVF